jgi:hypothetical protein
MLKRIVPPLAESTHDQRNSGSVPLKPAAIAIGLVAISDRRTRERADATDSNRADRH